MLKIHDEDAENADYGRIRMFQALHIPLWLSLLNFKILAVNVSSVIDNFITSLPGNHLCCSASAGQLWWGAMASNDRKSDGVPWWENDFSILRRNRNPRLKQTGVSCEYHRRYAGFSLSWKRVHFKKFWVHFCPQKNVYANRKPIQREIWAGFSAFEHVPKNDYFLKSTLFRWLLGIKKHL